MKAGRELDALMAKKVMKWRINGVRIDKFTNDMYYCELFNTIKIVSVEDWKPSTQIQDAWLVVEEMRADDYSCGLFESTEIVKHGELLQGWRCYFEDDNEFWEVSAKEAELAICLAALKAVA